MKSKINVVGIILIFSVVSSTNFLLNNRVVSKDVNLIALEKVALASGELECKCESCPDDESGCWSYDYSITECGGTNSGYEGSWQCEGAGRIERHVIECNPSACQN